MSYGVSDADGVEVADGVEQLAGGQTGPAFHEPGDEQGKEADGEVGLDMAPGPDGSGRKPDACSGWSCYHGTSVRCAIAGGTGPGSPRSGRPVSEVRTNW